MGAKVHLRKRDYDSLTYTCYRVNCSNFGYQQAKKVAWEKTQQNVEFSKINLLQTYIKMPMMDQTKAKTTCCSELTAEILNAACNYNLIANQCTPSYLASFLQNQPNVAVIPKVNESHQSSVNDGSAVIPLDFKSNLKLS